MLLPCTINGQPATLEIDRETLLAAARKERGALSITETAHYLGVCEKTVHTHAALKNLHRTAYGTITMSSIEAHLANQTETKKARKKTRRSDSARYAELSLKISSLKPGSPEHTKVWKELEAIKNRYGGKQLALQ